MIDADNTVQEVNNFLKQKRAEWKQEEARRKDERGQILKYGYIRKSSTQL